MAYTKNDPSPKPIKAKVVNASDGAAITSGVAAYHVTGATRTAAAGALTHIANGLWNYTPTQEETNFEEFAVEFYHASAVAGGPVVQVFTATKQVVVQPLMASVQRTDGAGGVISGWTYARLVASWNVKDVDLSGHDLRLILYNRNDPASAIVEYSTGAGEITITYNNPDSLVEVDGPDSKTPNAGNYAYVLRDQTTDTVLLSGNCLIQAAPDAG